MLILGIGWKPYWGSSIIVYDTRISGTSGTFVHTKF